MTWTIIIAFVVVFDLALTVVLMWSIVKSAWQPFHKSFPAAEPAPDAVTRDFQSFKLGILNFGSAVHVAADERFLHLRPARVLRWLGAESVSVPWESISVTGRSKSGRWITARIGRITLKGPAWCLELAEASETDAADEAEAGEADAAERS